MAGNAVIRLADRIPDPNADVITLLETLLEEAKAGNISGIAVAYSSPDRGIATCFQYENWLQAVGASALLNHDVLHSAGVVEQD